MPAECPDMRPLSRGKCPDAKALTSAPMLKR